MDSLPIFWAYQIAVKIRISEREIINWLDKAWPIVKFSKITYLCRYGVKSKNQMFLNRKQGPVQCGSRPTEIFSSSTYQSIGG